MVEKLLHGVLMESLTDKQYSQEHCKAWTEKIGDTIKTKLKGDHVVFAATTYHWSHELRVWLSRHHNYVSQSYARTCIYSLSELNLERYKYVVQVVVGEQRGEGVK